MNKWSISSEEIASVEHVVCFSGGHSSALVAIEVVRRYGREGVVLLNHDISAAVEDADIKRFKCEVADYIGIPITYASFCDQSGKIPDQFDVCVAEKAFKTGHDKVLCTDRLKTRPFGEWLESPMECGSTRTASGASRLASNTGTRSSFTVETCGRRRSGRRKR